MTDINNTIQLGDCYDVMRAIPDSSVDMLLTDPPYGTTNCAWDCKIDIPAFFDQVWRVCKRNAAVLIFSQLPFACDLINAARRQYRYDIVWVKNRGVGFMNARKMPLRAHELILAFYKALPTYNPQMTKGTPYKVKSNGKCAKCYEVRENVLTINHGTRYPLDVLKYANVNNGQHSTQKPLALVENLIRQYSNPGELVLDPFAGSGTTAVAAHNTGRRFIAVEKDPAIHAIASARLACAQMQKKRKQNCLPNNYMSRLLPYKEAAAYIGMSESTLYKLMRKGEIFPESHVPNPNGKWSRVPMFSTDDLDLIKEQLYPKPDPAVYLIREEAAKFARIKIGMLKDYKNDLHPEYAWHNGKRHVYYRKDELRALRKRLDRESTPPKGYVTPQEFAKKIGSTAWAVRKYAQLNKLPLFRSRTHLQQYYPEAALRSIVGQIEYGKQYNQRGGSHKQK